MTRTALFVHGGPGLDASIERRWFGASLPVRWFDQPRFAPGTAGAFEATVASLEAELEDLARREAGPVPVVAWSFGARLALEVSSRRPDLVASLALLGPTRCVRGAFVTLARRLGAPGGPLEGARARADAAAAHADAFWPLAEAVLSLPDLVDRYWGPASRQAAARWAALVEGPLAHEGTFQAVTDESLRRPPPPPRCFDGPATLLLGEFDPLLEHEVDAAWWRERLPAARARVVPCGHMVHFERPPTEWLEG